VPSTRRWNLNEREGRYAATNLSDGAIDLHLGLKRRDGTTVPVGRYKLDLWALSADGYVTRREVAGASVFDVQIYRESNGSYTLGVRRDQVTSLRTFELR
jgi:hypothetical protein